MRISKAEIQTGQGTALDAIGVRLELTRKDMETDEDFRGALLRKYEAMTQHTIIDPNEIRIGQMIDRHERELAQLIGDIRLHVVNQAKGPEQLSAVDFSAQRDKGRQLSIARTVFEDGFMRLRRGLEGKRSAFTDELDGGLRRD